MSSPVNEKEQYSFPAFEPDDGSFKDSQRDVSIDRNYLKLHTSYADGSDHTGRGPPGASPMSPSQAREQSQRLGDDLEMLRAERVVSEGAASNDASMGRGHSINRSRSRTAAKPVDDFDIGTTPIHEKAKIYEPPAHPTTKISKLFKRIHCSSWLVRYLFYITPVTLILLIPLLLGALPYNTSAVGGVHLFWFSVWLEICWLTLWAGRILAKCIPYPMGVVSSLFTNNDKKWRDLGKQLELPATLFFWWLAIEISFLPTMANHHADGDVSVKSWEETVNKIIVSIFVGTVLNFVEKVIIQLIAISFHLRTYADRIDVNKFQIGSLVKLYVYSKEKITMEDSEFENNNQTGPSSGARTPMQYINKAGKNARQALTRVGDVAGKVAGDFTGKAVTQSTHPHQVILQLLSSTSGSQVLARRLYRTFAQEDSETVSNDDLKAAFDNNDEANSAFLMFDKDMNGDISMGELEAVCVEIGRERKAITASLKDLDSVVSKLDDVFSFIVIVITLLVFVSLISTSAQGVLTSAGSAVLALSWLFSATAQEFLQSVIFVFVKHPFDVGDRVTIYGNTGETGKGDDYFVKEISLLYTEFKKMEGQVVQAPNNYLNTLFILNHRRSGGVAEAVPVNIKFGTTLEQIETLRTRLLEFVASENREYQGNILTELRSILDAYSITLNIIFFYKSNWQNELLRLQRRNKFICALMVAMQEVRIEGPRQNLAGQSAEMPMYLSGAYPPQSQPNEHQSPGPGPRSGSLAREQQFVPDLSSPHPQPINTYPSVLRNRGSISRPRGESIAQMGKRVDFSLGMSSISSGAMMGDVYDESKPQLPVRSSSRPPKRSSSFDVDDGGSLGKTSSRDSKLNRVVSAASSNLTHRNRFFGRNRSKLSAAEEGTDLDNLEAGMMPGIPEASGANSATGRSRRGSETDITTSTGGRIDARSGLVSPQAVASDSVSESGRLPMSTSGPRRAMTDQVRR